MSVETLLKLIKEFPQKTIEIILIDTFTQINKQT